MIRLSSVRSRSLITVMALKGNGFTVFDAFVVAHCQHPRPWNAMEKLDEIRVGFIASTSTKPRDSVVGSRFANGVLPGDFCNRSGARCRINCRAWKVNAAANDKLD